MTRVTSAPSWGSSWSSLPIRPPTGSAIYASSLSPSVPQLEFRQNPSEDVDCFLTKWIFAGSHPLAKYVASFDSRFNNIFMDTAWRELFCRTERPTSGRTRGSDLWLKINSACLMHSQLERKRNWVRAQVTGCYTEKGFLTIAAGSFKSGFFSHCSSENPHQSSNSIIHLVWCLFFILNIFNSSYLLNWIRNVLFVIILCLYVCTHLFVGYCFHPLSLWSHLNYQRAQLPISSSYLT